MFIEFEETPNPDTLKFLPGRAVLERGTRDFAQVEDADDSPLAQALFSLDGVVHVFLGPDFVAVGKSAAADWDDVKPRVLTALMRHFAAGAPAVLAALAESASERGGEEEDEIVRQIREILETRVAPAVARDGGHIAFSRFENGIVFLRMEGACAGCPSSMITLRHGVENLLKHFVPEIVAVEAETA